MNTNSRNLTNLIAFGIAEFNKNANLFEALSNESDSYVIWQFVKHICDNNFEHSNLLDMLNKKIERFDEDQLSEFLLAMAGEDNQIICEYFAHKYYAKKITNVRVHLAELTYFFNIFKSNNFFGSYNFQYVYSNSRFFTRETKVSSPIGFFELFVYMVENDCLNNAKFLLNNILFELDSNFEYRFGKTIFGKQQVYWMVKNIFSYLSSRPNNFNICELKNLLMRELDNMNFPYFSVETSYSDQQIMILTNSHKAFIRIDQLPVELKEKFLECLTNEKHYL